MKHFLLVFSLVILGSVTYGQTARVVGYLPTYRFASSSQIEYCKLTHLNLSFANPDSAGNIAMPEMSTVMSDALSENPEIIICISLGGGVLSAQQANDWSNLIDIPANRPAFISKIVDFVVTNNFDGVDMDLEWGHVTSGYSPFVIDLDTALSLQNKILTAAFPNQTKFSNITTAALDAFDFINIMSYDAKGPWSPSSPGQHSSFSFSTNGINFWKNTIGIPGDRLNLGVPFYGYDFINASTVNSFTYASMVASNSDNADLDNVGTAYYNGRPTIEAKVSKAKSEVGGIMIWEIGQDSFDEYSLLTAIHDKYTSMGVYTSKLCGNNVEISIVKSGINDAYKVYPNPTSDYVIITHGYIKHPDLVITNILGQVIYAEAMPISDKELFFDLGHIARGIYFITLVNEEQRTTQKLIVY